MDLSIRQRLAHHTGLSEQDRQLIMAVQDGLPLVSRPYAVIGERLGISEAQVLERLHHLLQDGVIKRLGVVVRHRRLGYQANAMVVWNVPDDQVQALGQCFARFPFVRLCYQRPRRGAQWPYNLFCMIHGQDRSQVLAQVDHLVAACDTGNIAHQVLFSARCFKQVGANYTEQQKARKQDLHEARV